MNVDKKILSKLTFEGIYRIYNRVKKKNVIFDLNVFRMRVLTWKGIRQIFFSVCYFCEWFWLFNAMTMKLQ